MVSTGGRQWRTLSLQVSRYGPTLGYGLMEVMASADGGIRRRVLARGACDIPDGVDVAADPAEALRLAAEAILRG